MGDLDLTKPWQYNGKWLIWPNTVLGNGVDLTSCRNTINGVCRTGMTIEQCMERCSGDCAAGYFVDFKDGRTVCAPLRTALHPHLSPIYRLRDQSSDPGLSNVDISTFVNTDVFPFPPENANVVFYHDILTIQELGTQLTLGSPGDRLHNGAILEFNASDDTNITLLQTFSTASQISQYLPIKYGDNINIGLPGTSLAARQGPDGTFMWLGTDMNLHTSDFSFQIIPLNPANVIGDVVVYGDRIGLSYAGGLVTSDPVYHTLRVTDANVTDALSEPGTAFTLVPKMMGYYCLGNKCSSVPLKDIDRVGKAGRYKGVTVGRNPSCWGACNYLVPGTNNLYAYATGPQVHPGTSGTLRIVASMVAILIVTLLFIHLYYRIKHGNR